MLKFQITKTAISIGLDEKRAELLSSHLRELIDRGEAILISAEGSCPKPCNRQSETDRAFQF